MWKEPKTDWQAADVVSKDDFNRIEGNIQELQNTKETPAGAQAKADAALNSAKQYTDQVALPKTGGTMTGILTAQSNTSYTVRQVRNIILSTADADVDAMENGDIWIKYK